MSTKGKKSSEGRRYRMDPRMQRLLSRNKTHGNTEILGMCLPLLVFVILVVLGYIGQWHQARKQGLSLSMTSLATSLLINVLVGYLIYELCKRGHTGWAWFVVFLVAFLLPLLIMMFLAGVLVRGIHMQA